jgi:tetratricopeptide (TPR) repeat protein
MTLRLSKTIVDQPVKLNFSQTETTLDTPNISPDLFLNQLHDWVSSKLGSDWLKVNFVPWSSCSLVEGPAFMREHPALQLPLITALPNFIENVLSGKTFHDILEQKLYDEEPFQKAMHFLLIQGVISWNRGNSASAQDSQKKLLTKINHQMSGKKNFEIYDVMVQMVSGRANQPDRVYQDFMAMLGEKPSEKDSQLLALYNEVVKILTQAYQFSKSGSYIRTKNEAEKGDAEKQAKLGSLLEEAKFAMSSSNFKAAATQLAQIRAKDPNLPGLRVVWCWSLLANLNSSTPGSAKSATLKSVEIELLQVSPEEKLEALYSFVQGLVAKFKGDPTSAKKLFEKSLSLDSKFIPAKRELNFLNVRPAGDKDLKDVFGSLFKRK